MRCKKGDIAVIERDSFPENVGRVVTVIGLAGSHEYHMPGVNWWVECASPLSVGYYSYATGMVHGLARRHVAACLDEDLRPIRDPGEDATDETLLWLPAPSLPVKEQA